MGVPEYQEELTWSGTPVVYKGVAIEEWEYGSQEFIGS